MSTDRWRARTTWRYLSPALLLPIGLGGTLKTTGDVPHAGQELLRTYQPEEGSAKTFCSVCGANLFGGGWPDAETTSVRLPAIDSPFEAWTIDWVQFAILHPTHLYDADIFAPTRGTLAFSAPLIVHTE